VLKASINETPKSNADKRKTFTTVKIDLEGSHSFEPTGVTWIGLNKDCSVHCTLKRILLNFLPTFLKIFYVNVVFSHLIVHHILRYVYDVFVIRMISTPRKHIRLPYYFFMKFWTLCSYDDSLADGPKLGTQQK